VKLRRIVLRLTTPSRHGDDEIVVLTNLPATDASAQQVMQLYRERWQVERLFLTVTQNFEGEINTLAYPKAALFSLLVKKREDSCVSRFSLIHAFAHSNINTHSF